MNCPNCRKPFALEHDGKYKCDDCGWFECIEGEWHSCETPEPQLRPEPKLPPVPKPVEPDPKLVDMPAKVTKEYLGGLMTVTYMENDDDE